MGSHQKQRNEFMSFYNNSGNGSRRPDNDMFSKVRKPMSRIWSLMKAKTHQGMGEVVREKELDRKVIEARKSVSHVETNTNVTSVAAFLHVKVLAVDMPGFMQVHAFRCARRTFDSLDKFSSKHMAYNMKKEFDRVYGPAWHCIVGSTFGSFVTYSTGCFLYFSMEKIFVLVFKTKIQRALD